MDNLPAYRSARPVAIWLLIGVGMIIMQIILGGITRLTGSGLSITEWDIVTGTLPPMNEGQWLEKFDKYRQTAQFQLLNTDFSLPDFKFIFFWEWLHRLWARLIGMVFLIPFIIFLFQRRFRPSMVRPMIILFLLGALQGAVGWIMVASGLEGDSIYVRPTRLALHFIFALGLLCYTFWFALQLLVNPAERVYNPPAKKWILFIMLLLLGQLLFGALMAGHKAATAAATWPDINGQTIPTGMFRDGLQSIIDNKITIHFIHRGLAYLLVIAVIILTILLLRIKNSSLLRRTRWLPFYLVVLQLVLGIYTVLNSLKIVPNRWGAFEWLAQSHQVVAMLFLLAMLWMIYAIGGRKPDFR